MTARWAHVGALSIALFAPSLVGCQRERTSGAVCASILDRIVEVELAEQGFHDEALAARKKQEMRQLLESDLRRCAGRRLRPDALACAKAAHTTEEISHVCLR